MFHIISDSRSDGLPLIQSPLIVLGIIAAYLYIVLSLGPKWMQNRPAFQIKNILIVYNAFQIVTNFFVWIYVRFTIDQMIYVYSNFFLYNSIAWIFWLRSIFFCSLFFGDVFRFIFIINRLLVYRIIKERLI